MKFPARAAVAVLFMILLAAVPILLFSGIVKIPFVDLPVFPEKPRETNETGENPTGTGNVTLPVTKTDPHVTTGTGPDVRTPLEKALGSFVSVDDDFTARGYVLSDGRYNKDEYTLAFLGLGDIELPGTFSFGEDVRKFYLRSDKKKEDLQTVTSVRPSVFPRMGFIFVENENGKVSLLYSDGSVIFDEMPEDLSFVGARDENDNPVFLSGKRYVYYSPDEGAFVSSLYNPTYDYRGIEFDYPSYYGKSDGDVDRTHNASGYWGYRYADGGMAVGLAFKYRAAWAFRDGYGLLAYNNGNIDVRDRYGTEFYSEIDLVRPEHDGIENLGFYFFEYGLMRARVVTRDRKGSIDTERTVVLGRNGMEFYLPPDYTVVSYSDGVFQMEKNGKYGYISYLGSWICDPVYSYSRPFIEGLAVVGYKNGKKGLMDTEGRWVVEPVFDEITNCSGGVIALYDEKTGYYILEKFKDPENTEEENG